MNKSTEVEKGSYLKINLPDWFSSVEGKEVLVSFPRIGLPTTHIVGKAASMHSQILIPFNDGDSVYRKVFPEYVWYSICAKAVKAQFNHGWIWITNNKEVY